MARRRSATKREYRLSFGGTRKKIWTATLRAAVAEARYWTSFGQKRVCIDKKLPSGAMQRIRCVRRRGRA